MDPERLLRMDLQNWTIRVPSPTALRGVGLHYWADPMTVLPAWQPRREGEQPGPHLQVCKAAYFAADARNNTEWQTRTLGTRSDGGTTDEHRRQRPPSATSQVHQLADQLGPDYFTYVGFRPDRVPSNGEDDGLPTRAAFYAYAAAALARQITHRRGSNLSLSDALTHPTYRMFQTRLQTSGVAADTAPEDSE